MFARDIIKFCTFVGGGVHPGRVWQPHRRGPKERPQRAVPTTALQVPPVFPLHPGIAPHDVCQVHQPVP